MRILYFIAMYGAEFLGQEMHRELIQELHARGHELRIFAIAGKQQSASLDRPSLEDGYPVFRAPCDGWLLDRVLGRLATPLFIYPRFLTALWYYIQHVRQHPDFDIVHVESVYPLGVIAAIGHWFVRRPFTVHIAGGDVLANEDVHYGYGRYRLVRALARFTFARAALVRAISPYAAELARRLGCPPEKIIIVPRSISRDSFLPDSTNLEDYRKEARARIAARYNLGDAPLVVATGRLLPIKGFDYLIRALSEVSRAGYPAHLLLLGPDREGYGQKLRDLAQSCGLAGHVTLTGAIAKSDLRDFLAAADVVAAPSIEEGGNKTVIEAAAVGTPFIITETAGNSAFARNWDCGLIVPPRDEKALAGALVELLQDSAKRRQMGQNGCLFARNFTTEVVAARLAQAYELVVRGQTLPEEFHTSPVALQSGKPA